MNNKCIMITVFFFFSFLIQYKIVVICFTAFIVSIALLQEDPLDGGCFFLSTLRSIGYRLLDLHCFSQFNDEFL